MPDPMILDYAKAKGFHQRTLDRWLKWDKADGDALLRLALDLKLGENHLRDFMDWLEEIALRDSVKVREILKEESIVRIASEPRLSRGDKLKRIKDEVRRLRFPRLSEIEGEIQMKIRGLKLQPGIQMSVPPALEGGTLSVEIKASKYEDLKRLVAKLTGVVENDSVREIFGLLTGGPIEGARRTKA